MLDGEISEEARKQLSEEIIRAEMTAAEARRIYRTSCLANRKMERVVQLGEASRAAAGAGDHPLAQEMFTAQKAAKIEKERLERERRTRA